MKTIMRWLSGLVCLAVMSLYAHGQAMEGAQTTVVTEAHWVTDGLILKLATGHTVKIGSADKARATQLTWKPYETEIRLQLPPVYGSVLIMHWTYMKANPYGKDTSTKAAFKAVLLGKT